MVGAKGHGLGSRNISAQTNMEAQSGPYQLPCLFGVMYVRTTWRLRGLSKYVIGLRLGLLVIFFMTYLLRDQKW